LAWYGAALLLSGVWPSRSRAFGRRLVRERVLDSHDHLQCRQLRLGGVSTARGTAAALGSFGNIKTPSASNKNVLIMATLENSILTNTLVASRNGINSNSTASGAVVVRPM
jgi:hypothetical protein